MVGHLVGPLRLSTEQATILLTVTYFPLSTRYKG